MELGEEDLAQFFSLTSAFLDERQRRLQAASMVEVLGRGGQARVAEATSMSRNTLIAGAKDLAEGPTLGGRIRRPGGGPKRKIDLDPELLVVLDSLVEPESRGDPMSPLRWTLKSTRVLARELTRLDHLVGANLVGDLLHHLGYSLQANAKVTEGSQHADRDAQFRYINDTAAEHLAADQPVINLDCKKKELVGDYANRGKEWEPKGKPTRTQVHDFPNPEMGKAIPYGVLDVGANEGWVNVGDDHDTPAFAVASIARWWERMGKSRYPDAKRLMITADAGGSNSYRSRVFKVELAKLAATIGLVITVCHMPPGTSKWNKIEHRLFSFISMNWRGKPLTTYRTVVELIAGTTTRTGLKVQADLDTGSYPTGVKITDKQLEAVPIERHDWHPDWNYTILPP
ncbi:MAG: ISAzo13 family transposase [Actinobacteria bacterium]|nr:ISAzo13 family transposase [Actinomycetota bacterium]